MPHILFLMTDSKNLYKKKKKKKQGDYGSEILFL